MYVNHIERLKSKIREMEVTNLANEARPKASEDRLEHQQRTIHGNAVLLQTRCNIQMHSVQADHAALQVVHVKQQVFGTTPNREAGKTGCKRCIRNGSCTPT